MERFQKFLLGRALGGYSPASGAHSALLFGLPGTSGSDLWIWGAGDVGQTGLGKTDDVSRQTPPRGRRSSSRSVVVIERLFRQHVTLRMRFSRVEKH